MSRTTARVLPHRQDAIAFWTNPAVCASGVFLIRYLANALRDIWLGGNDTALHIANLGIFQLLAWSAVFLLLRRASIRIANFDAILIALISFTALAPDDNAAWLGLTALAFVLLVKMRDDRQVRAAATVMLALATQLFWGRLLFELVAFRIEIIDANLAAGLLTFMKRAVLLDGNLLNTGSHQIVIYEACTSFHNISLALLCWVSVTKLARPQWQRADLLTAASLIVLTVAMNSLRLFLMANAAPDAFDYWHTGTGSQIINAGLSAAIPIVCLAGSRKRAMS